VSPAELILAGGRLWTGVSRAEGRGGRSRAEPPTALAIRGGRIAAVGTDADIRPLAGPRTELIELDGRFATPGLIDAHTHFLTGGFRLAALDLRGASSREEFVARIAAWAGDLQEGAWITGGDWDHELWGGALPDREWIDSVTPRNPVYLQRLDWHMALVNSRALSLARIDADTPAPPGGAIVRDERGRPTGIVKDAAMRLVSGMIPAATDRERDEALRAAMRHAAGLGITAVHDMGSRADLETYRRVRERGELATRLIVYLPMAEVERVAAEPCVDPGRWGEWLRVGGLKAFVDGSLGSGTALFEEPYEDEPTSYGLQVTPTEELEERVRLADAAGLQVAVHAIGDRANALLLDLYARVQQSGEARDRRFRVEHAQHLRPVDFARFAALGVVPSMQPSHAIDDGCWAERRIGARRGRTSYAFRSLLDSGARLAFGSDWAVASLNPLEGLYAAVTRRPNDGSRPEGWIPEERLQVCEALRAFTTGAAWAGFQEGLLGTLEVGRAADVVVWSGDLLRSPAEELRGLHAELTLVGGRVVFSGGAA